MYSVEVFILAFFVKIHIICSKIFIFLCFLPFQGVPMNSLRFLFEGQRIADNHTPKEVSIISSLNQDRFKICIQRFGSLVLNCPFLGYSPDLSGISFVRKIIFFFFLVFLGPQHMEVPRLEVKSELQLPA